MKCYISKLVLCEYNSNLFQHNNFYSGGFKLQVAGVQVAGVIF
jgi:hypothetical protein